MSSPVCRRCYVSGRVQGVFFRASTAREATALGVSGHALNLPDGRVEVVACGDAAAVDALCAWLRQGPPAARVDDLSVMDIDAPVPAPSGFRTG